MTDTFDGIDDSAAITNIRKEAAGRQFALRTWQPAVGRVDGETFWCIWRDGANYSLRNSAKLNGMLQVAAEAIVLVSQAEAAAPTQVVAAALQMLEHALDISGTFGSYTAVLNVDLERLREALGLPTRNVDMTGGVRT